MRPEFIHPRNITSKCESHLLDPGLSPVRRNSPEARAFDADTLCLKLGELRHDQCRFAVNDAAPGETHLFCGRATLPLGPYCAHHALRVRRMLTAEAV